MQEKSVLPSHKDKNPQNVRGKWAILSFVKK